MRKKVCFRADGNSMIGLGHVIRSCALADTIRESFDCFFFIQTPLPGLPGEIAKAGATLRELPLNMDYEAEAMLFSDLLDGDEIVVLDGYRFDTTYQQRIKDKGCRLVCIDDIHAYHFMADVVINHSGGVRKTDYSAEEQTVFCLGSDYVLLRASFRRAAQALRNERRYGHHTDNVLICMGGADPENATLKVLQQIRHLTAAGGNAYVVLGAGYRYHEILNEYMRENKGNYHVFRGIPAEEMVKLMTRCDTCICPPSSISFEYMSIGGAVFLYQIADNQSDIYKYFIQTGLAFDFSEWATAGEERILRSIARQREVFDGKAGVRLLNVFKELANA